MTRRSFFKICAVASVTSSFPSFVLTDSIERLPEGVRHIGNFRETIVQDIRHGDYIVRYDALCGKKEGPNIILDKQYGVDFKVLDMAKLPEIRKDALDRLISDMVADKVDFDTLIPFDNKLGDKVATG